LAIETKLADVLVTFDGGWSCYDVVITASDICTLWQTGFLKIDDDRQRGCDMVSGKPILSRKKIEQWAEGLIANEAIFGQLTWNFRPEDVGTLKYDSDVRSLTISPGAYIPDSRHRHEAIVMASQGVTKGNGFDTKRRFSVRIYNVSAGDENRIFYAMNQEGQKADATRSKWLHPSDAGMTLAATIVRQSPHLQNNVDTVRNTLSKRNHRLVAFNTLSRAFERHWPGSIGPDGQSQQAEIDYLLEFWRQLVYILPQLDRLDLSERQAVRETSLVDSALSIWAYVALARRMKIDNVPFSELKRLAEPDVVDGATVPFFSRENPRWERMGVLVPTVRPDGTRGISVRNARESRDAMAVAVAQKVGLATGNRTSNVQLNVLSSDSL
jgi:DNA-sulfur modification-associated